MLYLYNNTNKSALTVIDNFLHGILKFYLAFLTDCCYFASDTILHQLLNGFTENISLNNGEIHNVVSVSINRATSPGFPFKVELNSTTSLQIKGLMRAISEKEYSVIPTLVKNN